MFALVLFLLLASRAVFVFPILAAHNYWARETLPLRHIVVAWCPPACTQTVTPVACSVPAGPQVTCNPPACHACHTLHMPQHACPVSLLRED